jgi:hypothetical protein
MFRQQIHNLSLAFIPPLRSDNYDIRHLLLLNERYATLKLIQNDKGTLKTPLFRNLGRGLLLVSPRPKKFPHHLSAPFRHHAAGDRHPVIQPGVGSEVIE